MLLPLRKVLSFFMAAALTIGAGASAQSLPAVDGINGKLSVAASGGDAESYALNGSVSFPIGHSFGFQIDGHLSEADSGDAGSFTTYGVGTHAFWRDPSRGLFGFYGHVQQLDVRSGLTNYAASTEAEIYLDRFTISNLTGFTGFDDFGSEFFSLSTVAYYPTDDLRLEIGHTYSSGLHALTVGSEWDVGKGNRSTTSLFANAILPEYQDATVNVGVQFYFGQKDKSLIRRHREDDPPYFLGSVFLIAVGYGPEVVGFWEIAYQTICPRGILSPIECYFKP